MRLVLIYTLITSLFVTGCTKKNTVSEKQSLRADTLKGQLVYYLPSPNSKGEMSVEEAISTRRSHRNYIENALSAEVVSQILWAAYGMSSKDKRTAPSAGATYPLEVYALIGNVKGIEIGVYKYQPQKHMLIQINAVDVKEALTSAALNQEMIRKAPFCLFYSAVYSRTVKHYGSRGQERYVCMDLGHSAQNVYLQATSLRLGTCAIGAFNDDEVKKVMNLPDEEVPLYIMPIGRYIE